MPERRDSAQTSILDYGGLQRAEKVELEIRWSHPHENLLFYIYVYKIMIMDLFPTPLSKLHGLEDVRGGEL